MQSTLLSSVFSICKFKKQTNFLFVSFTICPLKLLKHKSFNLSFCLSVCLAVIVSLVRLSGIHDVNQSFVLYIPQSYYLSPSVDHTVNQLDIILCRLSLCQSVCYSVCLSVCISVCLPICLSVCLSVCLFVCLSVCLSVSRSICLSVCLSVGASVCVPDGKLFTYPFSL